jgi:hypothetical protein
MVKAIIKTPLQMGGFWNGSEDETPKAMIKSPTTMNNNEPRDDGPTPNVEGSLQYYQKQGHL